LLLGKCTLFKANKAMLSHGATFKQGSARLACKSTQWTKLWSLEIFI